MLLTLKRVKRRKISNGSNQSIIYVQGRRRYGPTFIPWGNPEERETNRYSIDI